MALNNELEILKQAILNELEGYNFYLLAAQQTKDADAREAFSHFAKEEITPPSLTDPPSPHIFSWSNAGTERGSLAVSVFGIAINMEKAAVDFYKMAAGTTKLDAAKKLYLTLVKWEEEHLASFEKHYDELKEAWWQNQGFSPS
jgi:rubrerythrin